MNKTNTYNNVANSFINDNQIPKLSDADKNICDMPITMIECGKALQMSFTVLRLSAKNRRRTMRALTSTAILATAFMLIASRVIFLFHRVIIEEYCIIIIHYRKNECQHHTFYTKADSYNFFEVPVIV